MRAAEFQVSTELLGELLHLPAGSRIIGATYDFPTMMVVLVVDDPALPEADRPHRTTPTCHTITWNWNVE